MWGRKRKCCVFISLHTSCGRGGRAWPRGCGYRAPISLSNSVTEWPSVCYQALQSYQTPNLTQQRLNNRSIRAEIHTPGFAFIHTHTSPIILSMTDTPWDRRTHSKICFFLVLGGIILRALAPVSHQHCLQSHKCFIINYKQHGHIEEYIMEETKLENVHTQK